MSEERVSIVVLTHNRWRELRRTLERLDAFCRGYPVIVVDNGSTDGTADHLQQEFPAVLLVRVGKNLGAAGRNHGVAQVTTPYVAFCDDDTCWAPGALERAADLLDAHAEIAVLNARILVGADARLDPACAAMAQSPLPALAGIGPELVGFMAGANVMRTRSFMDAGGYWEPFFIGGEETLLSLDIMADGGRIVYAPDLETYHWPSKSRDAPLRRRMLARNALWTAWLRLPAGMAARRSLAVLRDLPGWPERLRACRDALAGWELIREHRRRLDPATCEKLNTVWQTEAAG
ncbi:glycosyltransferase [Achromobacter sp. LC458]|uniref:Glycosyl transferase family 2 n=1 Tax=Achromobacter spanius TaxID=217203 RepID=A0A2S5GQX6_9BURK|nr:MULTISPECIES: glycosyltransferase [Achromobacter]AYD65914.1 glycosyltransferase [Achromobacter sp. B7]MDX3986050.1 glycosyltransferase [Achromobacter sp.]PPA75507.1 glycosyl transferase family 2 [Achromobacter spanius]TRM51018.1 glycosyltransferase [Achromobacter sp. LC458]